MCTLMNNEPEYFANMIWRIIHWKTPTKWETQSQQYRDGVITATLQGQLSFLHFETFYLYRQVLLTVQKTITKIFLWRWNRQWDFSRSSQDLRGVTKDSLSEHNKNIMMFDAHLPLQCQPALKCKSCNGISIGGRKP